MSLDAQNKTDAVELRQNNIAMFQADVSISESLLIYLFVVWWVAMMLEGLRCGGVSP
jgi:hypothetical protein